MGGYPCCSAVGTETTEDENWSKLVTTSPADDGPGTSVWPNNGKSNSNEKLLDKYSLGQILGQGAFGVVYSCTDNDTGTEYAVKMIDKVESPLADIKREIEMLQVLSCQHIVRLHNVYFEKVFIYMVLDLLRGGDLIEGMQAHWETKGMIPIDVVKNLGGQMLDGVVHLHSKMAGHFDIKGDNYLMDKKKLEDPDIKILLSDFGTVAFLKEGERRKEACGTKLYWAPEFYKLNYGLKVDVFAVGVVMFGLVEGKFPFKNQQQCMKKEITLPGRCPEEGQELIKSMLMKDENKRCTAAQARVHKFLEIGQISKEENLKQPGDFQPEVKESGANGAVKERRLELVNRIQEANNAGAGRQSVNEATVISQDFEVLRAGRRARFAWWTQAQVDKEPGLKLTGAKPAPEDDFIASCAETTKEPLKHNL
jgi:serine/threonine protein kinase